MTSCPVINTYISTAQPGINILLHQTAAISSNTRRLMLTDGMGQGSSVFLDERDSLMPHLALAGTTDKVKHSQLLETPPNAVDILT